MALVLMLVLMLMLCLTVTLVSMNIFCGAGDVRDRLWLCSTPWAD